MNLIEFDNGAFKDEIYGTKKYGLTNLTKNSILQQCCDKLSYIKGMYDNQEPLNRIQGTVAYMRPLNYWLRCRPTISRDIAIQIE